MEARKKNKLKIGDYGNVTFYPGGVFYVDTEIPSYLTDKDSWYLEDCYFDEDEENYTV